METTVYLTTFVNRRWTFACDYCGKQVKTGAGRMGSPARLRYVLVNVREAGRWVRMLRLHAECYDEMGRTHGNPVPRKARSHGVGSYAI